MTLESARELLENALPELEKYILSETLYWQVRANNVPLTIGNLYFEALALSAYDRTASRVFEDRIKNVRNKWHVNWRKKSEREYINRLKLWEQFLNDASSEGEIPLAYYRTSARHRTILSLLSDEVDLAEEKNRLAMLDGKLRASRKSAGFIWARELSYVFPREEFWYLY